jgi:MOSC domain-containing protein YiiM
MQFDNFSFGSIQIDGSTYEHDVVIDRGEISPCCVMTTLSQGDLPKDNGILRTAAQHNRANVGVYASVLQGGKVRRGDSLGLE